ncbi:MAG TPA: hypothetical protein PK509_10115 [Catalimonadaceae bacterium]|nr:hypothetical protein [Catalimonadaceae bacterium]HPI10366.1 hypothetical protein [Catalimonadaceae bacterium]
MRIKHLQIIVVSLFVLIYSSGINAQTVEINEASGSIKDKSLKGFVVCLELDVKSVDIGWSRYMKSLGKFETVEKQAVEGLNLILPAISSDAVDFYSKVTVSPRCIQIFMGALRAGSNLELPEEQKDKVRKMLYDFAIEQYRQDLIKQISEAERVVNLAVKAHDKRTNEGESLRSKITRNKKEKLRLLKDLEDNSNNLRKLRADSVQNASEQETALEEIKKVRQIAEEKKLKLGQVK